MGFDMDYSKYIGEHFDRPDACLHLVVKVWKEQFNRDIPNDNTSDTMAYLRENLDAIKSPRAGDLILLKSEEWHIGLVIKEGEMLHTAPDDTAIVERYDGLFWRNRIRGFYTWK